MQKTVDYSWQNQRGIIPDHGELCWWIKKYLEELGFEEEEYNEEDEDGDDDENDNQLCEWLFLCVHFIGFIV